jgi:N-acetylmuramoyl-L-alanine amidase
VHELRAAASREGSGPRAVDALRAAADLDAARFALTRDATNRDEADVLYDSLAAQRGVAGCAARMASARMHALAGDTPGVRDRYLAYERACPDGADLPHVHATLALMDPALAHAAGEAASARGARTRSAAFDPLRPRDLRRVVIDPGHGGSDSGARSDRGLVESTVTLDVARRMAAELSDVLGAQVILTRDSNVFVPLEARSQRANEADADLFVSIHCNSSPNPDSRGVATYVLDARDDRVAVRVAHRENGVVESEPDAPPEVFRILADLRLLGQGSLSLELAGAIQESLSQALSRADRGMPDLGIHTARFHVLMGARMPAVLVELPFLSNTIDAQHLADPRYRARIATALTAAIARYASGTAPTRPVVRHDDDSPRRGCAEGPTASPSAP